MGTIDQQIRQALNIADPDEPDDTDYPPTTEEIESIDTIQTAPADTSHHQITASPELLETLPDQSTKRVSLPTGPVSKETLLDVCRVLKPAGTLILVDPADAPTNNVAPPNTRASQWNYLLPKVKALPVGGSLFLDLTPDKFRAARSQLSNFLRRNGIITTVGFDKLTQRPYVLVKELKPFVKKHRR